MYFQNYRTPGEVQVRGVTNAHNPYELLTVQKVAIGVRLLIVKACDVTEIGIEVKSI